MSFTFAKLFKSAVSAVNQVSSSLDEKMDQFCDNVITEIESKEILLGLASSDESELDNTRVLLRQKIKDCFAIFGQMDLSKKSNGKKSKSDAPKKISAYQVFCTEKRDSIIRKNPGVSFGEISKLLGAEWKSLSEEEKKIYAEKAGVAVVQKSAEEISAEKEKKEEERKLAAKRKALEKEMEKINQKLGFESFSKKNKIAIITANPDADLTDIPKLIQDAWNAEQNKSSYFPSEDVALKMAEESLTKPVEKKELVSCQNDGCTKKTKGDIKFDEKVVCAECHRKLSSATKKLNAAPKTPCSHTKKDGSKCTNNASENTEFCSKHQKKTSPKKQEEPVNEFMPPKDEVKSASPAIAASPATAVVKSAPAIASAKSLSTSFDFNSAPVSYSDAKNKEFWECKGIKIEGVRNLLSKKTGLIITPEGELKGLLKDSEVVEVDELDKHIINWAVKSGIKVSNDEDDLEIEMDDDMEL